MILFVDASALVGIVRREAEADILLTKLADGRRRITSGVALWEASRAVARGSDGTVLQSLREVDRFCAAYAIELVAIGRAESEEAVSAQQRYGKGTDHPAKLNMGDCFAYACAKTNGATLLYKGDDFTHTDMA